MGKQVAADDKVASKKEAALKQGGVGEEAKGSKGPASKEKGQKSEQPDQEVAAAQIQGALKKKEKEKKKKKGTAKTAAGLHDAQSVGKDDSVIVPASSKKSLADGHGDVQAVPACSAEKKIASSKKKTKKKVGLETTQTDL